MLKKLDEKAGTLGADLRALRKARKLTLMEMSQTIDRSVGWLSQVERDISSPSIDELRNIAAALDVPISLFFGQADAKQNEIGRIVRKDTRRQIGSGENGLVEELLSPDLTDDFEVLRSVFKPNAGQSDYVARGTQEVGYILSGSLRLWLSGTEFVLNEGDSFRIKGERFKWENDKDEDTVVIWVIAPPIY